jgi:hypothetical protein
MRRCGHKEWLMNRTHLGSGITWDWCEEISLGSLVGLSDKFHALLIGFFRFLLRNLNPDFFRYASSNGLVFLGIGLTQRIGCGNIEE